MFKKKPKDPTVYVVLYIGGEGFYVRFDSEEEYARFQVNFEASKAGSIYTPATQKFTYWTKDKAVLALASIDGYSRRRG